MGDYLKEALFMWSDFYKEIVNKNRFFPECKLIDILKAIIISNEMKFNKDTILYRARKIDDIYIFTLNEKLKEIRGDVNFFGFDKNGSSAPSGNNVGNGRANPQFIPYLYLSEDEYTAVAEVRPIIFSRISMAKLKLLTELNIVNLCSERTPNECTNISESMELLISHQFSTPVDKNDSREYIPTQFIAEYIKHKGYDGIRYRSSMARGGINLVIFDSNKAEPYCSEIIQVEDIQFSGIVIAPPNGRKLIRQTL